MSSDDQELSVRRSSPVPSAADRAVSFVLLHPNMVLFVLVSNTFPKARN